MQSDYSTGGSGTVSTSHLRLTRGGVIGDQRVDQVKCRGHLVLKISVNIPFIYTISSS